MSFKCLRCQGRCVTRPSVKSWSCLSLSLSLSLSLPKSHTHTSRHQPIHQHECFTSVRWRDASMATSCRSCGGGWAPTPPRATGVTSAFGGAVLVQFFQISKKRTDKSVAHTTPNSSKHTILQKFKAEQEKTRHVQQHKKCSNTRSVQHDKTCAARQDMQQHKTWCSNTRHVQQDKKCSNTTSVQQDKKWCSNTRHVQQDKTCSNTTSVQQHKTWCSNTRHGAAR